MPGKSSVPSRKRATAISIRGDERGGGAAPDSARLARDPERGETRLVGCAEVEPRRGDEIRRDGRRREALGVREGVLDGKSHIRGAQLGLERAVDEQDGRVDDALRMHDDVDGVVVDIVQPVCFDDLQALVREGGRVDRDLGAHRPRRMAQCLLRRHARERLRRGVEERAARGGEHQAGDRGAGLPDQALPDRRVLGVDRAQPRERGREGVGGVEAPRAQPPGPAPRPSRGGRPRRASPCSPSRRSCRRAGPPGPAAARRRPRCRPRRCRRRRAWQAPRGRRPPDPLGAGRQVERRAVAGEADGGGSDARGLGCKLRRVAAARERDDGESVGVALQDLEGLRADAPRRAQQRDADPPPLGGGRPVSGRSRGHTARRPGRRTGTSRCGRGSRRAPGSACPSPLHRQPA